MHTLGRTVARRNEMIIGTFHLWHRERAGEWDAIRAGGNQERLRVTLDKERLTALLRERRLGEGAEKAIVFHFHLIFECPAYYAV